MSLEEGTDVLHLDAITDSFVSLPSEISEKNKEVETAQSLLQTPKYLKNRNQIKRKRTYNSKNSLLLNQENEDFDAFGHSDNMSQRLRLMSMTSFTSNKEIRD